MKRTPLRRKGKRGLADDAALDKARPIVWARDRGRCRRCNRILSIESRAVGGMHHISGRKGPNRHDPDNLMLLCHLPCHRWVTDHPKEAKEQGFSR